MYVYIYMSILMAEQSTMYLIVSLEAFFAAEERHVHPVRREHQSVLWQTNGPQVSVLQ